MNIEILTKNYTLKEHLKDLIYKKVSRLEKFFSDNVTLKVTLKKAAYKTLAQETMELTIIVDGMVLRSEVTSNNMFENIDVALPKLEKQIIKHRGRLSSKSKKISLSKIEEDFIPEIHEDQHKVVRTKKFPLIPMTVEDAIEELELTDHTFYVFLNKDTKTTNVLYIRKDGDYGLIDTVI